MEITESVLINGEEFKLILEGIETEAQFSFLKDNHCNMGQGYLFSRPLKNSDLEVLLREWQ